jgi:endonuclease/exonuclease/phosphatase family metal-dependent hydrolase
MAEECLNDSPWTSFHSGGELALPLFALFKCAEFLTYGWDLLLNDVLVLAKPVEPSFQGQADSAAREYTYRVLRVLRVIILTPINLTFGAVGAAVRAAITGLFRKGMMFVRPSGDITASDERCRNLRICTYNVALMPEFIAIRNGLRPSKKRATEIADAILKREDDIICMQEAFDNRAAKTLANKIKHRFPFIIYHVRPRFDGLNSGLMVASKYPISNPFFWEHRLKGGADELASKGTLHFQVHLSKTQRLFMVNTHLNGGTAKPPTSDVMRKQQIDDLVTHTSNYMKCFDTEEDAAQKGPVCGLVTCGDWNISPFEPEGPVNPEWAAQSKFFIQDNESFTPADVYSQGSTYNFKVSPTGWDLSKLEQWPITHERVDYILFSRQYPQPMHAQIFLDNMEGGSDHLACRGMYQLQ